MEIDTQLPLRQLEVYVLRDFEAEKKLVSKDPKAYGVGEIRFPEKDVQEINTLGTLQISNYRAKCFANTGAKLIEILDRLFRSKID